MIDLFKILWESTKKEWTDLKLDRPKKSRKRKTPSKYDDGAFTPENKYNQVHKEIIDYILSNLQLRFNSDVRSVLDNVEMSFIKPKISPQIILEFYKNDLSINKLKLHSVVYVYTTN